MRVAICARYSSENQRDASIADQVRICREFVQRQEWAVPELRIIDDELWQGVQARYATVQHKWSQAPDSRRFNQLRRPKYLFSGLTKCGQCGAGFIVYSREHLGCFGARGRGTCSNTLTILADTTVERPLLSAIVARVDEPLGSRVGQRVDGAAEPKLCERLRLAGSRPEPRPPEKPLRLRDSELPLPDGNSHQKKPSAVRDVGPHPLRGIRLR